MRLTNILLPTILGTILLIPIALMAGKLNEARSQCDAAQSSLQTTTQLAIQFASLREQEQVAQDQKRPEQDVYPLVSEIMARAGVDHSRHFDRLRPEGDDVVSTQSRNDGPRYRRQSFRVEFKDMTTDQLGRFLAHWCETQPIWTPTQIQLSHNRNSRGPADRYDCFIKLSALYVASASENDE